MTEQRSTALALPDEQSFRRDMQAINRFQAVVHQTMIAGQDYGIIPGTQKPTLLKPGAEKIAKLLGLADTYEIVDRQEDWQKPFFRFLVKCKLVSVRDNIVISEGLGECNSMEGKYRYRWVSERDLPEGADKSKLIKQERKSTKTGGHWFVYRLENEDIFSQVNTLLKMAKKRALVDASLSAGRLSDVFTQDIEDIQDMVKVKDEEQPSVAPATSPSTPEKQQPEATKPESNELDLEWVKTSLETLQGAGKEEWSNKNIAKYLSNISGKIAPSVSKAVSMLTKEQAHQFKAEIESALGEIKQ